MILNIKDLKEHPLSKANPKHGGPAFIALKESIKLHGQLEPIKVYRNMILDGRHRCRVLKELECLTVDAVVMPHNMTLKELQMVASSTEVRRHQTKSQLAIKAFYMCREDKSLTQAKAAKLVGIGVGMVKEASGIYNRKPALLDILYDDKSCSVGGSFTTSLRVILEHLKREEVSMRASATNAWESDNSDDEDCSMDPVVKMLLSSIANLTAEQKLAVKLGIQ